jgi:ABC-type taurine transport system substrate-binding protein
MGYLKTVEQAHQLFRARAKEVIEPLVKFTNLPTNIVEAYLSLYETVPLKDLVSAKWMGAPGDANAGVPKALGDVASFLVATKQVGEAPKSFAPFIDSSFAARLLS